MRLLYFGDVVGRPGRRALQRRAASLARDEGADFVVANAENVAGGIGVDPGSARELLAAGIHVLTSGNHVWKKREIYSYLESSDRVLRPLNFAPGVPGRGFGVYSTEAGEPVAVVNLIGRVFMDPADCPFRAISQLLESLRERARVILVDMHAEATSEKAAMGRYLDGRVSAVVGSHTHVQTADETILPGGTAYITDVGMCGPMPSVLGMEREIILHRFRSSMPTRFEVADQPGVISGVVIDVQRESGRATAIRRVRVDQRSE